MKRNINNVSKIIRNPNEKIQNFLIAFSENGNNTSIRVSQLINGLLKLIHKEDLAHQSACNDAVNFVIHFCSNNVDLVDNILINSLLTMCFELKNADKCIIFWNDIKTLHLLRSSVSYSLLLKCLIECNEMDKCLETLQWMNASQYKLKIHDSFITRLICNCTHIFELKLIDSLIVNQSKFIKTQLILSYSSFCDIDSAINIFHSVIDEKKDIVLITAMMTAFIDNGYDDEAIKLYDTIDEIKRDHICDNLAIKACGNCCDKEKGKAIYQRIGINGNLQIQNSFIDFFGDCGQIQEAMDVYNSIDDKQRDIVSIGALMKALVNNEWNKDALKLYDDVDSKTGFLYCLALKACTKLGDFEKGKQVHKDIIDDGFKSSYITSGLIDFYGNFGDVKQAMNVYNSIQDCDKDIVAVNAMLTTYLNNNLYQDLVQLYDSIDEKNGITHNIALKACANLCDLEKGKQIHSELERNASDIDIQIKNTLIGFYGNCSNITKAWNVFDCIKENERDIATINSI